MCLLTLTKPGATPDYGRLYQASLYNGDGFGFAVIADDEIIVGRGMDIDLMLHEYAEALDLYPGGPSLFHLRLATHGDVGLSNVHPFYVDSTRRTVMAHNGILPIDVPKHESRSDTRIFAEDWFPSIGIAALNRSKMRKKLRKFTGSYNKLAFLTVDPESAVQYRIIGEDLGHWREGTWYSNDSYKYTPRLYSTTKSPYYLGSRAWDDEDEETGSVSDPTYDVVCESCGITLTQEEHQFYGYCETCGACTDCFELPSICMCYRGRDHYASEYATVGGDW